MLRTAHRSVGPLERLSGAARGSGLRTAAGVLLGLLAATLVVVRFVNLGGDPSWIVLSDHITDEGWYSQHARNHALFGTWITDEHNPGLVLTPAYTLLQRLVYLVAGVSFASTRVLGALSSVGVAWIVFAVLRGRVSTAVAGLAAAMLLANPLLYSYARVAFVESSQMVFIVAVWGLVLAREHRLRNYVLAGVAAAVAVTFKPTAAIVCLLVLLGPWIRTDIAPRERPRLALAAVGGGIAGLIPVAAFVARFRETFLVEFAQESSLVRVSQGLSGFGGALTPFLFGLRPAGDGFVPLGGYGPAILPLIVAGIAATLIVSRGDDTASVATAERQAWRMSVAWIALILVTFAVQQSIQFRPRYWLQLIVPVTVILVLALTRRSAGDSAPSSGRDPVRALVGGFLSTLLLRGHYLEWSERLLPGGARNERVLVMLALLGAGWIFFAGVIALAQSGARAWRRQVPHAGVMTLCAVLAVHVVATAGIALNPTFTIRDASRRIAERWNGTGTVLTGSVANTLSIESRVFAYETRDLATMGLGSGLINDHWRALGATHVLSTDPIAGPAARYAGIVPVRIPAVTRLELVPDPSRRDHFRYTVTIYEVDR